MKQSPAVYPANVFADTQNRQQIATILQSMGFETEDIAHAFHVFERSYGDKKYDISVLTEIVFQVQNGDNPMIDSNQIQSHSAPNSPNVVPSKHINEAILHYNKIETNNNNNNSNDMLSIFNSLDIKNRNKASSVSPIMNPIHNKKIKMNPRRDCNDKNELELLSKYASSETEIIDVLLQTLNNNNNNDIFNNMVNWNDLSLNIKRRNMEWNEFQTKLNYNYYDEMKHKEIERNICNHKSSFNKVNIGNLNNKTSVQKALTYSYDLKRYDLLNKKDKLLITANTYSILKNNKEKTELMITKCNEKLSEINDKMLELQNEKKQYFSALMRTKNKLLFQIQSIRETEISIKELHETTNKIQREISHISSTKKCVDKFEKQLNKITKLLKNNFAEKLESNWNKWSNRDVIIWIKHIENERFNDADLSQIAASSLSGKDLPQMNDFILRSFQINDKNERNLLLKNIERIIKLKPKKEKEKEKELNLCVVCSDDEANYIMIPCGHIAVCHKCVKKIKKEKKCPFCTQKTTKMMKCFHVGF